ncbi:MAG: hypothetical protein HY962_02765 [Ignavibacteriae bacterium]|nr:hypothetical protein [Ignavibacteriota bacterium]
MNRDHTPSGSLDPDGVVLYGAPDEARGHIGLPSLFIADILRHRVV